MKTLFPPLRHLLRHLGLGLLAALLMGGVGLVGAPRPALAVAVDQPLADPAAEVRAMELSKGLRCLVCQNQSIEDSNAELARDLRRIVRERIVAGDDDAAVKRMGELVGEISKRSKGRIQHYSGSAPIFENFGVQKYGIYYMHLV